MKKILALALSVLMLLSFAACGNPETPDNKDDVPASTVIDPAVKDGTWGAAFWADFRSAVAANAGATSDVIASALLAAESGSALRFPEMGSVEAGYIPGFGKEDKPFEISGFKNGTMFATASGRPFMGYVFELEAGADVKAFVKSLKDNVNLGWMVCMFAENATIGADGNYVLAILSDVNMPGAEVEAEILAPEFDAEGTVAEALWNEFVLMMQLEGAMALSEDLAHGLSMGAAFNFGDAQIEALEGPVTPEGFKYAIEGYNNGVEIKAGSFVGYIFQIEDGMLPDSWGDYNLGMNMPEGQQGIWGAYGNTLVLLLNTEA